MSCPGWTDTRTTSPARCNRLYVGLNPQYVQQYLRRQLVAPEEKVELKSPEPRGTTGFRWPFHQGAIYWRVRCGAHPVWGPIGHRYDQLDGCRSHLGFPVSGEITAVTSRWGSTGRCQRFEGHGNLSSDGTCEFGASIYLRADDKATFATSGAVGKQYELLDGTAGSLGFPTSGAAKIASGHGTWGGQLQLFEGGAIYCIDEDDARAVTGNMYQTYLRLGGHDGRFGLWSWFPGPAQTRSLACNSPKHGSLELFAIGDDGRTVHRWYPGERWSPWSDFGFGTPVLRMTNVGRGDGELEVFAVAATGRILKRWHVADSDDWSPWEEINLP